MFVRHTLNLAPVTDTGSGGKVLEPLTSSAIQNALAEDDSDTTSSTEGEDKAEFDLSILDNDVDDKEVKDEEDPKEEEASEEEGSKEDEEEEESLESKVEDDDDEIELAKIPRRKEILAKYPKIFKDFPALEHIIHREHAFAEVFPTVGDAKAAKESVGEFNKFQSQLLSGNIEDTLKAVRSTDPKAFNKITSSFLDTLVKIDANAHLPITQQVAKGILNYIHSAAGSSLKKNPEDRRAQQLQIASELIHEALYDTSEVTPYSGSNGREENTADPEREKLSKDRQEFEHTRFTAAFNSVAERMQSAITSSVAKEIDPRGILPPYVKKNLVKEIVDTFDKQATNDSRFRGIIDKLWLKAKESNYSRESIEKIKEALRIKAKTELPAIMKAKKGEALKGLSLRERKSSEEQPEKLNGNRGASQKKVTATRRDEDRLVPKDGEKIIDFLMRD